VNSLFCACYYAIVNRFFFCYSASDVACLIAACVPASVIAACVPASSTPSCICQIFSHLKTGVVRSTARAIGSQISGGWFVLNLWFFFWHAQQSYHALPLPALLRSSPLTGLRLLLRRTNSSASHPPRPVPTVISRRPARLHHRRLSRHHRRVGLPPQSSF
jgi:hypothetical protein